MDTLKTKKTAASFDKHCGLRIISYCITGEGVVKYLCIKIFGRGLDKGDEAGHNLSAVSGQRSAVSGQRSAKHNSAFFPVKSFCGIFSYIDGVFCPYFHGRDAPFLLCKKHI